MITFVDIIYKSSVTGRLFTEDESVRWLVLFYFNYVDLIQGVDQLLKCHLYYLITMTDRLTMDKNDDK